MRLLNSSGALATSASGGGRLQVLARDSLRLDGGDVAVDGAKSTLLRSTVIITDDQARWHAGDALRLETTRLSADTGAEASLIADGGFTLTGLPAAGQSSPTMGSPAAASPLPAPGLGARLVLQGSTVLQDGLIDLPAGALQISATVTAAPAGEMTLRFSAASTTRLNGQVHVIDEVSVHTPGGSLIAKAASGSVRLAGTIDVSGAGGLAATDQAAALPSSGAGNVSVQAAAGSVDLGGTLRALSLGSAVGGELRVDSLTAVSPAAVAKLLVAPLVDASSGPAAGSLNFDGLIALRNRSGNQIVPAGTRLQAQRIELSSDAGSLIVQGETLARADSGGTVLLSAGQDLTLDAGSRVTATVTAAGAAADHSRTGRVELSTASGRIAVDEQACVDLNGPTATTGGSLLLRAPRGDDGTAAHRPAGRPHHRGRQRVCRGRQGLYGRGNRGGQAAVTHSHPHGGARPCAHARPGTGAGADRGTDARTYARAHARAFAATHASASAGRPDAVDHRRCAPESS